MSKETKWTPGPWSYGELSETIIDRRGHLIASVEERSSDLNVAADARLMAAAPDLAALAQAVVSWYENAGNEDPDKKSPGSAELWREAKKALAKARPA